MEDARHGKTATSAGIEVPALSFAEVFARVFVSLAELHAGFPRDGLLAAAVWEGSAVTDYVHVPLGSEPEFLVVGRHPRCDLLLDRDRSLSLRHAVIMARARGGELHLRCVDLLSGTGLATEGGLACEALSADGALFVRMGGYHLFLLPTGSLSPLSWEGSAEATWSSIPERIHRDCRPPSRDRGALRRAAAAPEEAPLHRSIRTEIVEPPALLRAFRPPLGARGTVAGELQLGGDSRTERIALHEADLARGLLVGRHQRCQLNLPHHRMSRVHLLVISDGGELWAVDTASSNGIAANGAPVRRIRLQAGVELTLARQVSLRWAPQPRE